jgi:hypothetical protein
VVVGLDKSDVNQKKLTKKGWGLGGERGEQIMEGKTGERMKESEIDR